MFKKFVFLCVAMCVGMCAVPAQAGKLSAEGAAYKRDLVREIGRADKIVVTEHSDKYDFFDGKTYTFKQQEELVYQTRVLRPEDVVTFKRLIKAVPDKTQDTITACIFEPHHTIKFYAKDELLSTLPICFKCGDQQWDGTKHTPPQNIISGLYKFIKAIDLHPELNWRQFAAEQLKKDTAQTATD